MDKDFSPDDDPIDRSRPYQELSEEMLPGVKRTEKDAEAQSTEEKNEKTSSPDTINIDSYISIEKKPQEVSADAEQVKETSLDQEMSEAPAAPGEAPAEASSETALAEETPFDLAAAEEVTIDGEGQEERLAEVKIVETPTGAKRERSRERKRRWLVVAAVCVVLALVLGASLYPVLLPKTGVAASQPTALPTTGRENMTGEGNQPAATIVQATATATPTMVVPTPTPGRPTVVPTHAKPLPTPTPFHNPLDVTYHGGYVQLHPTSYLIFWGAAWQSDSAALTTKQLVESYFQHAPGSSYAAVLNQYYMVNSDGSQSFISGLGPSHTMIDPVNPTLDDSQDCSQAAISDTAIQQEITHAMSANGWPDDHNAAYFVYMLPGVVAFEPGMGCSNTGFWGADHEWTSSSGAPVAYAIMPYPWATPCTLKTTDNTQFASDAACKDAKLVMYTAHEQLEIATDPLTPRASATNYQGAAWFYANPGTGEIGDLCAGIRWRHQLNGATFVLQEQWSNKNQGCV